MTGSIRRVHPAVTALLALGLAASVLVAGVGWMARSMADALPEIEHAHAIALDAAGRLLLGHHDGIVTSADGGRSWTSVIEGWDVMAVAPRSTGAILVAGHGFVGSVDATGTLTRLDGGLSDRDVHSLSIDPVTGDIWIATASGTVQRSRDDGATWEITSSGPVALLAVVDDGLIGVDPFEGLTTSIDGRSWAATGVPPTSPVASLARSSGSGAIAITGSNGVWVSDDGGATWRMASHGPAVAATFRERDGALLMLDATGAVRELSPTTVRPVPS
jgi:photosystem II stability/assembly factor-like uncharacterized protein